MSVETQFGDGNSERPKTNEFWHYIFNFLSVEMR